jgi:exodeoxyribonuclease V alpha subunit
MRGAIICWLAICAIIKDDNQPMDGRVSDKLQGAIERITYYNNDTGYAVLKILPEGKRRLEAADRDGLVTAVGVMPQMSEGESVELEGEWVTDARFGKQFRVQKITPITPTSKQGITRYLASGIVTGLGDVTAERIVQHFGLSTLEVLDKTPQRLDEVRGLKPALVEKLREVWPTLRNERRVLVFLQTFGITARTARKIFQYYTAEGEDTIAIVQKDPYCLAEDIFGIGFRKADQIARNMGVSFDAPGRLRAGLSYGLQKLAQDGHTFAPRTRLIDTTAELLELPDPQILIDALEAQLTEEKLYRDELPSQYIQGAPADQEMIEAIYLPMYYHAEAYIAPNMRALSNTPSPIQDKAKVISWPDFLSEMADAHSVELTELQQSAVQSALQHKVTVLTGGPGTGKTTTLRMVINALQAQGCTFELSSPTGRAAKRLNEATGYPAQTVHRLLGFKGFDFEFNEDNQLKVDMLIVDECSMVDLWLFYHLLQALPETTHLLMVGDVDQLPSVGAGNVLHDVIDSGLAYVTRLETIFRQSNDSLIVTNAHRINHGEMPNFTKAAEDFFIFRVEDPQAAVELLVDVVVNRIPSKFGIDPIKDIQVLAPMYRGPVGVDNLNDLLQQRLNPFADSLMEKRIGQRTFRVGDKLMQTRNNYDKEVFNGDVGFLRGINDNDNLLEVSIDDRIIEYGYGEVEELRHAYCISTHRSQGSEYPVVVMPVLTQHYMMLQRNLLYTAITRAKKVVVLVGTSDAIRIAVQNNKVSERYSGLLARMKMLTPPPVKRKARKAKSPAKATPKAQASPSSTELPL